MIFVKDLLKILENKNPEAEVFVELPEGSYQLSPYADDTYEKDSNYPRIYLGVE